MISTNIVEILLITKLKILISQEMKNQNEICPEIYYPGGNKAFRTDRQTQPSVSSNFSRVQSFYGIRISL